MRALLLVLVVTTGLLGGESEVALEPEAGGDAFRVQGEYASDGASHAAQVVALAGTTMRLAIYAGGLPGAGWDGKTRLEVAGTRTDATAEFANAQVQATVSADGLRLVLAGGTPLHLKKVQRQSPTLGAKPPAGAAVLFGDDRNVDAWQAGRVDDRGLLTAGTKTKKLYRDFTLHVEFRIPFKPAGKDQDRGNSGLYLQDRYEIQILDSFGSAPLFNDCGSIYRQTPPDLNMCLPPLSWQTYDIDFTAARFEGAQRSAKARITVRLNGVAVHQDREITAKTGAGKPEAPEPGPIQLQGHGNPVFFRNVWIVER